MEIKERLEAIMAEGRPVGFCRWKDADETIWGTILAVKKDRFVMREIDPQGKVSEKETICRLKELFYLQCDPVYSARLLRLGKFRGTKPKSFEYTRSRSAINNALDEAFQTGECIHVRLRGEEGPSTVRVLGRNEKHVDFMFYDDLMTENERTIWRRSCIKGLRWRTLSEEADDFLLELRQRELKRSKT